MKKILCLLAAMILFVSCETVVTTRTVVHPKIYHYDNHGHYKGYSQKDSHGRIRHYDEHGRYKGKSHK